MCRGIGPELNQFLASFLQGWTFGRNLIGQSIGTGKTAFVQIARIYRPLVLVGLTGALVSEPPPRWAVGRLLGFLELLPQLPVAPKIVAVEHPIRTMSSSSIPKRCEGAARRSPCSTKCAAGMLRTRTNADRLKPRCEPILPKATGRLPERR
jgi:hypothetical protein